MKENILNNDNLKDIEKTLKDNISNKIHNSTIVGEMLAGLNENGIPCGNRKECKLINHLGSKEINTLRLTLRK